MKSETHKSPQLHPQLNVIFIEEENDDPGRILNLYNNSINLIKLEDQQ